MDPEQSREQLRTVLRTCGADLTLFEDSDLDIMLGVRFRSGRALQGATREGLTASGLPPGLVDHILTLKGAAAGPDSGSSAAAGLRKLRLRQDSQNEDLFFFEPMDTANTAANAAGSVATLTSGVSSSFFLDPEGRQTFELQEWLRLVKDFHHEGKPIPPLLINGLVKTGKSFTLNEVLPAVARTYYGSSSGGSSGSSGSSGSGNGGGGDNGGSGSSNSGGQQQHYAAAAAAMLPEPNFLHVNCMGCERVSGTGGFLADFLRLLTRSAAVQQLSDAASTPVPSSGVTGVLVASIQDFMWRLPRDRLNFLLIDEAQSFYLLVQQPDAASAAGTRAQQQRGGPVLADHMAVESMRRVLKQLQLDSPPWVAWAVTGSAMATLWANMAATPTNGFPLNMHHYRLDLRPTVSTDVLRVAWHQLKRQAAAWSPPPPDDLVWRSPPHHATLAFLCQEWRVHSRTASSAELLVQQTMTQKLLPEVLADLRAVLAEVGQPDLQLLLLRRLLDPLAGVEQPGSYGSLHPAFVALLASYTTTHGGGSRLFLDSPPFAEVLQAITKASGALVDSPAAIQWPSSCRLRFWREMITLCKTCEDSDDLDSCMDLHALLGDMAAALQLPPDDLLKAKWFVDVRDHDYNGHRYDFVKKYEAQAQQDAKVGLRCFHALLRPVLDYRSSWDEQLRLKHAYPSELHEFLSSGRVSEVLTKTYNRPLPNRSGKLNAPRAQVQQVQQVQPHARPPSRPVSLCWGKQPLRRAVRYMGRM